MGSSGINAGTDDVEQWSFGSQSYSLRRRVCGKSLPCCIQMLLRHVTENEAIWFPSRDLKDSARRLRAAGWSHVESQNFQLTLGARVEFKPWLIADMVACLWDASWVW